MDTDKITVDGARLTIWVRAEINAGLVAAAIPPLKSLFENVLRQVFGVRSQSRSNTAYATQIPTARRSRPTRPRDLEDDEIAIRHSFRVDSSDKFQMHELERSKDEESGGRRDVFGARYSVTGSG